MRSSSIAVSSRYASVNGDVSSLHGLSDMQFIISHKLEKYNLVFNAGLNIPSGKTKLNTDEFITSRIISQNLFNLKTPNFGQGMNVFLGATWTYPPSDKLVLGTGLSYQIKSKYQPLDTVSMKYQPSNEVSATAGFDYKFNEFSTLTTDITAVFYGSDKVDNVKIFSAGDRAVFSSVYKKFFGYNLLSVLLVYRFISSDKLAVNNPFIENEKFNPNQFYMGTVFTHRISGNVILKYGAALSLFEKTASPFSGYTLFNISLSPEFKLSPEIRIPVILSFASGSAKDKPGIKNYEIGAGIKISL
jgi:hypothetical protein